MVPLEEIQAATRRLLRSIDEMSDADFAEASLLPDWSRAHVVAHVTLNAEGLAGALSGVVRGTPVPMYASQEARDSDIAEVAGTSPAMLRTRLLGATSEFAATMDAVPDDAWGTEIERTPGGPRFVAAAVPGMREREVAIHHADLGLAFSPADWPDDFSERLLENMCQRPHSAAFVVHATDLDRKWECGDGEVATTVSGLAADLGWWLTGRGKGERLTTDDGAPLPGIEAW